MEQKIDIQTLINLASVLAQYSQIHTVTGVSYAGQPTHAQAIEQTQKWLNMNCDVANGEYQLKAISSPAKAEQEGLWKYEVHHVQHQEDSDEYATISDGKVTLYIDGGEEDGDELRVVNLLNQLKIELDYDRSAEFVAAQVENMYNEACEEIRRLKEQEGLRWVKAELELPKNTWRGPVITQRPDGTTAIKLSTRTTHGWFIEDRFNNECVIKWLSESTTPPVKEGGQPTGRTKEEILDSIVRDWATPITRPDAYEAMEQFARQPRQQPAGESAGVWRRATDELPELNKPICFRIYERRYAGKMIQKGIFSHDGYPCTYGVGSVSWLDESASHTKEGYMDFAKWVTEAGYSYDKLNGWLDEKEGEYSDKQIYELWQQSLQKLA